MDSPRKDEEEENFKQTPSIVIEQPKVDRQLDTDEVYFKVEGASSRSNRPAYIRKLKKTAEDYDFYVQNSQQHSAHEVVRPN